MQIKVKKVLGPLVFLSLVLFCSSALAAGEPAQIDVNLPGPYDVAETGPVGFIGNFYYFALGFGGLLAFASIVYAGIKWTASQGNPGTISDAKDQIVQALWGLVLLGGAFIILNTINPELTILQIPKLSELEQATGTVAGGEVSATSTCSVEKLKPMSYYGSQAEAMEGGQTIIWDSSDSNARTNLAELRSQFGKLQSAAIAGGFNVSLQSAYRPAGYQEHFYEIKSKGAKIEALSEEERQKCSAERSAIDAERDKHQICKGVSYRDCKVAPPNSCAPHIRGIAVDISLGTGDESRFRALDDLLKTKGITLRWKKLSGDPYHFELTNPPAGCAGS